MQNLALSRTQGARLSVPPSSWIGSDQRHTPLKLAAAADQAAFSSKPFNLK